MKFKIDYCRKFDISLAKFSPFSLISATPIITRIKETGLCWRVTDSLDTFVKLLEDNLTSKYNEFYGLERERDHDKVFHKLKFLRQCSTKIYMDKDCKQRVTVIGSKWRFDFGECNPLLQFALDCGLGERNSMGFGFVNVLDSQGRLALVN
jgi:CRISPR-associated endoribonuclease Cas6